MDREESLLSHLLVLVRAVKLLARIRPSPSLCPRLLPPPIWSPTPIVASVEVGEHPEERGSLCALPRTWISPCWQGRRSPEKMAWNLVLRVWLGVSPGEQSGSSSVKECRKQKERWLELIGQSRTKQYC